MGEGGGEGGRDIIHCSCHPNHRETTVVQTCVPKRKRKYESGEGGEEGGREDEGGRSTTRGDLEDARAFIAYFFNISRTPGNQSHMFEVSLEFPLQPPPRHPPPPPPPPPPTPSSLLLSSRTAKGDHPFSSARERDKERPSSL